jgi:glycosyltransferase involved in cell wall biosynthesis
MAYSAKRIIFDVTRLIRRGHFHTPTGIDRIERKYTEFLLNQTAWNVEFEAWLPVAGWRTLSRHTVQGLTERSNARWRHGGSKGSFLPALAKMLSPDFVLHQSNTLPAIRLTVAHNRPQALQQWHQSAQAKGHKICYFVHDLIPIEYPQFARAEHTKINHDRIAGVLQFASGILVNSQATKASLANFGGGDGHLLPVLVAPFGPTLTSGVEDNNPQYAQLKRRPYFLCIGTIEPRKNHLMLINIWRDLMVSLPMEKIPYLVFAGRRGWENKVIIALLERSIAEGVPIIELGNLNDRELSGLIHDARAVLMPSFAEGFGLPVAEALAAQCPVVASDIAAHQEVGGNAPLYIAPTDNAAWRRAILHFASDSSDVRSERVNAAKNWRPNTWLAHFDSLLDFMDRL